MTDSRPLAGRVLVELSSARKGREIPSTQIGAGSTVRLSRRRPSVEDEELCGVVSRPSRLKLSVALDGPPPDWLEAGSVCLELMPSEVTYERQRAGLRRLLQTDTRSLSRWRSLLMGMRAPEFEAHPERLPSSRLNSEQNEALFLALAAKDLALVHGPPGTGKTTVLAELIERAVGRGERVLATAASNMAVDNLLERLTGSGLKLLRWDTWRGERGAAAAHPRGAVEQHGSQAIARELLDEAHALLSRSRKQASRVARRKGSPRPRGQESGRQALRRGAGADARRARAAGRGGPGRLRDLHRRRGRAA